MVILPNNYIINHELKISTTKEENYRLVIIYFLYWNSNSNLWFQSDQIQLSFSNNYFKENEIKENCKVNIYIHHHDSRNKNWSGHLATQIFFSLSFSTLINQFKTHICINFIFRFRRKIFLFSKLKSTR